MPRQPIPSYLKADTFRDQMTQKMISGAIDRMRVFRCTGKYKVQKINLRRFADLLTTIKKFDSKVKLCDDVVYCFGGFSDDEF